MQLYKTPLRKAVEEYLEYDFSRLHMPGHKGVAPSAIDLGAMYDITEFEGSDSLYAPTGCILELEKRFSELYCTETSLLSAGGSTLCIQAMLALVAKPDCTLIAGRNIHISAVNAMALLGINPYWVYPEKCDNDPLIGRISPAAIQAALEKNPDAVGVYITSPDYFGVISDIKAISLICERYSVPLLVDNAHGAHLAFLKPRLHPIRLGASMCCDSLHKTLPVLTGGALLHILDKRFAGDAKRCMSIFGSTSPSYLIMLSADNCMGLLEQDLPLLLELTVARVQALQQTALNKGFV
ncbi:MAG: DegT/DnrJ/EryC1/StrS family aminotransferase, partial [Oscillospiraceae bacterium]